MPNTHQQHERQPHSEAVINHHLDDATLMAYAAGTLDESLSVVAASHMAFCHECARGARFADALGGMIFERQEETPLHDNALTNFLTRLDSPMPDVGYRSGRSLPNHARTSSLPRALARYLDKPLEDTTWKRIAPGLAIHELPVSPAARGRLHLFRIAAGKAMPEHGHGGNELTLVLSGSYSDCFGRFAPGDVADLDPDANHQPIVDAGAPCTCLIATEAPARFTNLMARIFQPVSGL